MVSAILADTMTSLPSLREEQAGAVRERLLAAAIRAIEEGHEPTMRTVGKLAGVSERTIYRYFPSRDDLYRALLPELRGRASASMVHSALELPGYAHELFTTFDANHRLVRSLASAPWAVSFLSMTRPSNLQELRSVLDRSFPRAPESERASAAASLRPLLSAAGWAYLTDCGFDRKACIAHAQYLVGVILERLRERSGGDHA
jgi:AcrR family transcriptional regulator